MENPITSEQSNLISFTFYLHNLEHFVYLFIFFIYLSLAFFCCSSRQSSDLIFFFFIYFLSILISNFPSVFWASHHQIVYISPLLLNCKLARAYHQQMGLLDKFCTEELLWEMESVKKRKNDRNKKKKSGKWLMKLSL